MSAWCYAFSYYSALILEGHYRRKKALLFLVQIRGGGEWVWGHPVETSPEHGLSAVFAPLSFLQCFLHINWNFPMLWRLPAPTDIQIPHCMPLLAVTCLPFTPKGNLFAQEPQTTSGLAKPANFSAIQGAKSYHIPVRCEPFQLCPLWVLSISCGYYIRFSYFF